MGLDDKIGNAAEKLGGKGKEATGDEILKAEGNGDHSAADLKRASDKVKEAFKEPARRTKEDAADLGFSEQVDRDAPPPRHARVDPSPRGEAIL